MFEIVKELKDSQICVGNKGFLNYLKACREQLKKSGEIEILSRGNLNAKAIHLASCLQEEDHCNIADISISRRHDDSGVVTELRIVITQ